MSALPPKADIRQRIEHVCFVPKADVTNVHWRLALGATASALRLQEGQQVGVDRVRLRGRHAMREALIGLQRAVLQKFC